MFSAEVIEVVFDKYDGTCRYCEKQITFSNYGAHGRRGAWHVDHSVSKANGGTNHLNNLFPACIPCNLEKGSRNGDSYIRWRRANNLHVPTREEPGFLDSMMKMLFG